MTLWSRRAYSSAGSNTLMLLCGWALAAYMAVSASMTRSSTDWPGSATRRPMLVPQVIRRSPISRLSPSALRILLATRRARTRFDLGSMTANSSPPRRATVSVVPDRFLQPPGDHPEDVIPRAVSQRVVDALERVEIEDQQRRRHFAPGRLREGMAQHRVQCGPVGQLGQRIRQRHPLEAQPGHRAAWPCGSRPALRAPGRWSAGRPPSG